MTVYEIIYDFSNDITDEHNITEEFTGDWTELQEYIKQMKQDGCYNISATAVYDYEEEEQ